MGLMGVYSYCGIQRCGKTTMMIVDLVTKVFGFFRPDQVIANFVVRIPGVKIMDSVPLGHEILRIRDQKARDRVILFDEASQFLGARGYSKPMQTEICTFAWQMPKRNILFLYSENIGNSVDKQLRDATWFTIMPKYHEDTPPRISLSVIDNYGLKLTRGDSVSGFEHIQTLFDTYEAID